MQKWILVALFVILVGIRVPLLDNPLFGRHSFRQTQTAMTAYWFAKEGIKLPDYQLPVFGKPWSAPMEFPTFQIFVSGLYKLGVPPDFGARASALLSYVMAVGLVILILKRLDATFFMVLAFMILATFSPFGIYWSAASLIEFTTVSLGMGYLLFALRAYQGSKPWLELISLMVLGAMLSVTKVTTFPIFAAPVAGLGLLQLWENWNSSKRKIDAGLIRKVVFWGLALGVPLVLGVIWVKVSDGIKASSEPTVWLTSKDMGVWNYGPLSERLDLILWAKIVGRISVWIIGGAVPFLGYGLWRIVRTSKLMAIVLGGSVAGIGVVILVFFNLYAVHDYYLCAAFLTILMVTAFGIDEVSRRFPQARLEPYLAGGIAVLCIGVSLATGYITKNGEPEGESIMKAAEAVRQLTPPDAELMVFVGTWSPALPYYCQRKAYMVSLLSERGHPYPRGSMRIGYVKDYVKNQKPHFLLVDDLNKELAFSVIPSAKELNRTPPFTLFEIQ